MSPAKLIPKLHIPKQTRRALQGFLSFISPSCSCTSIYGCLALMVREGQVLHVPAWKGLGIFSNRELDLFQVYHYLLLMVLPVVKLFWNTVALFFIFAPELDLLCAQVTKGKEKNNHSSCQSNLGSVLPITWMWPWLHRSYTGLLSPCLLCYFKVIVSPLPARPQGFLFSSLSCAHGLWPPSWGRRSFEPNHCSCKERLVRMWNRVLGTAFLQWNQLQVLSWHLQDHV